MIVALDLAIEEYTNVFNRNMRSATGGVKAPAINKAEEFTLLETVYPRSIKRKRTREAVIKLKLSLMP